MRATTLTMLLLALGLAPLHAQQTSPGSYTDPAAANWKTWNIASGRELRLPPPPDSHATQAEREELRSLAGQRATAHDRVVYWDAGPPSYRWIQLAVDRIMAGSLKGLNAARHIGLVNVAIYDATIAAWDTKYAYHRPRPGTLDPSVTTAVATPSTPSYPDEHAVTAAAAAPIGFPQGGWMSAPGCGRPIAEAVAIGASCHRRN